MNLCAGIMSRSVKKWGYNMNLPGVIIIGAQKCGTSSLHHYLDCHPEIRMSEQKELNFFSEDGPWSQGVAWYQRQFSGQAKLFGEASPGYTMYPVRKGVPERMHQLLPEAKLIYLVRHPVERMVSHYLDRVKGGKEQRSVEEALLDESGENYYFRYSQYHDQLQRYLNFYDRSAIHVEAAENLRKQRAEVLKRIFLFLGVDADFTCAEFTQLRNVSDQKLKRQKPRKVIRQLLLDKHSIYPRLAPWLAVLVPDKRHSAIIDRLMPGTVVQRPQLAAAVQDQILERLAPDMEQFREVTGIDFINASPA